MGIQLFKILIAIILLAISLACIFSGITFLIIIGMGLDILTILMLCADKDDSVIKNILGIK